VPHLTVQNDFGQLDRDAAATRVPKGCTALKITPGGSVRSSVARPSSVTLWPSCSSRWTRWRVKRLVAEAELDEAILREAAAENV
jgi:hypothetical protein